MARKMLAKHPDDLPRLIDFSDPKSFASFTLRERMPRVAAGVAMQPHWPPSVRSALAALKATLPCGEVPAVAVSSSQDRDYWEPWLAARSGRRWSELGFLEAEFVFYRAVFEIVTAAHGPFVDPYAEQKRKDVAKALVTAPRLARDVALVDRWTLPHVTTAVSAALLGNTADLSQLVPSRMEAEGRAPLVNDVEAFFAHVTAEPLVLIDVVLDNAGEELVADLALVGFLLRSLPQASVRLHAKPYPMFVSDATVADVRHAIDELTSSASPETSAWGRSLSALEHADRLSIVAEEFWGRPDTLAEMPVALRQALQSATAIVLKGDLNYRRYVGDRSWSPMSPITSHRVRSLPPVLSIRVLKSDVVVGLDPEVAEKASLEDPEWLHNGRYSIVQYFR